MIWHVMDPRLSAGWRVCVALLVGKPPSLVGSELTLAYDAFKIVW
jgi:hypothetical protein